MITPSLLEVRAEIQYRQELCLGSTRKALSFGALTKKPRERIVVFIFGRLLAPRPER